MSSTLNEENLERKFQTVTNTQDSIQTLSLWILHHKNHHKKIVQIWMKVLKKARIHHRLVLFYLANDVIQHSKRKGVAQYTESFAEVLKSATLLVRDEKIKHNIERVFNIWEERNVYDSDFISELRSIIAGAKVRTAAASKLIAEFKPQKVIEKIRKIQKVEEETNAKHAALTSTKIDTTNIEVLRRLKDRSHGQQFSHDFEEAIRCLEAYIKALEKEVTERTEVIAVLEQSEIYYEEQMGEAKQVANAYKSFGLRVKTLQKKLEELMPTLPSPVPSPCPDAPSPTNSDDGPELSPPQDEEMPEEKQEPQVKGDSPQTLDAKISEKALAFSTTQNSFIPQGPGVMTSWLGSFTTNSQVVSGTSGMSTLDSRISSNSTLEKRLSNLMEKIPNLPPSIQNTIFGLQNVSGSTPIRERDSDVNSPSLKSHVTRLQGEGLMDFSNGTPLKDEDSGQNTPLQDEDAPSTTLSFLSKLAPAESKVQLTPKKSAIPSTTSTPSTTSSGAGMPKTCNKLPISNADKDSVLSSHSDSQSDIPPALNDILKKLSSTFSNASSPYGPPSWLSAFTGSNGPDDEEKEKSPPSATTASPASTHQMPCYTSAPSKHPQMSPVNTDSAKSCRVTPSAQSETTLEIKKASCNFSTGGDENLEPMDMDLDDSDQEDNSQISNKKEPGIITSEDAKKYISPVGNFQSRTNDYNEKKESPPVASIHKVEGTKPLPPPPPLPTTIAASFQRSLYMDTRPLEPPPIPAFALNSSFSFSRIEQDKISQEQKFTSPNISSPFSDQRNLDQSQGINKMPPKSSKDDVKPAMPFKPAKANQSLLMSGGSSSTMETGRYTGSMQTAEEKKFPSIPPSAQPPKALFPISSYYSDEKKRSTLEFASKSGNDYKTLKMDVDKRLPSDVTANKASDNQLKRPGKQNSSSVGAACPPSETAAKNDKVPSLTSLSPAKQNELMAYHSTSNINNRTFQKNAGEIGQDTTNNNKSKPSDVSVVQYQTARNSDTEQLSNASSAAFPETVDVKSDADAPSSSGKGDKSEPSLESKNDNLSIRDLQDEVMRPVDESKNSPNNIHGLSVGESDKKGIECASKDGDSDHQSSNNQFADQPIEESDEKTIESPRKAQPKLSSAVSIVSTIQTIQSVRTELNEQRWWHDSMEPWEPTPPVRQPYGRQEIEARPIHQDRRYGEHRNYGFERQNQGGYNDRFYGGRERRPFGHYGRPPPPNGRFVNREPRRYYPPRY